MVEYRKLANKYGKLHRKHSKRFLAYSRPKVRNLLKLISNAEDRCIKRSNSQNRKEDFVEESLKELYLNNSKVMNYLSLAEIVSLRRFCENVSDNIEERSLTKREYKHCSSMLRKYHNSGRLFARKDYSALKDLI
jgi:hypothetical protein